MVQLPFVAGSKNREIFEGAIRVKRGKCRSIKQGHLQVKQREALICPPLRIFTEKKEINAANVFVWLKVRLFLVAPRHCHLFLE